MAHSTYPAGPVVVVDARRCYYKDKMEACWDLERVVHSCMLYLNLDPTIRDWAADELYVPNGLRDKIGNCQVTLRKDVVDSRISRRAVAGGSGKGNEEKKWLFSAAV